MCYYLSSVTKTCKDFNNSAVYGSFNRYLTIGFPCYSLYQSSESVGIKYTSFSSKVQWICDYYILLTVHLGKILVSNNLTHFFSMYLFQFSTSAFLKLFSSGDHFH